MDIVILPPPGSGDGNMFVTLWLPTEVRGFSVIEIRGFSRIDVIEAADFYNDRQLFSVHTSESVSYSRATLTLNSSSFMSYRLYDDSPDDLIEVCIIFDLPQHGLIRWFYEFSIVEIYHNLLELVIY